VAVAVAHHWNHELNQFVWTKGIVATCKRDKRNIL